MKVFNSALAALARGERLIPETSPFDGRGVEGRRGERATEDMTGTQIRDWGLGSVVEEGNEEGGNMGG